MKKIRSPRGITHEELRKFEILRHKFPPIPTKKELARDKLKRELFYSYYEIGFDYYNKNFNHLIKNRLEGTQQEMQKFKTYLEDMYPQFKEMTDRAIEGEKPTDRDQDIISEAATDVQHFTVRVAKEGNRWIPVLWEAFPPIPLNKYFRKVIFKWVLRVWQGIIPVGRCKAVDCQKIFMGKRSDQQYCSERCYNRQYKREKRALSRSK